MPVVPDTAAEGSPNAIRGGIAGKGCGGAWLLPAGPLCPRTRCECRGGAAAGSDGVPDPCPVSTGWGVLAGMFLEGLRLGCQRLGCQRLGCQAVPVQLPQGDSPGPPELQPAPSPGPGQTVPGLWGGGTAPSVTVPRSVQVRDGARAPQRELQPGESAAGEAEGRRG